MSLFGSLRVAPAWLLGLSAAVAACDPAPATLTPEMAAEPTPTLSATTLPSVIEAPATGEPAGSSEPKAPSAQASAPSAPASSTATAVPKRPTSACDGLAYCACKANPACEVKAKGCLCACDFGCPKGCKCVCGGGEYLGCKSK